MPTPIRKALRPQSLLRDKVANGLGALDRGDHQYVDVDIRERIEDSLEIDENLREGRERENRWDYLLGDGTCETIVGLEPHGASDREVKVVVAKRAAVLRQISPHLKDGHRVAAWFWVQSSGRGFLNTTKARRIANQNGITFVGRKLMAGHLDMLGNIGRQKR